LLEFLESLRSWLLERFTLSYLGENEDRLGYVNLQTEVGSAGFEPATSAV